MTRAMPPDDRENKRARLVRVIASAPASEQASEPTPPLGA